MVGGRKGCNGAWVLFTFRIWHVSNLEFVCNTCFCYKAYCLDDRMLGVSVCESHSLHWDCWPFDLIISTKMLLLCHLWPCLTYSCSTRHSCQNNKLYNTRQFFYHPLLFPVGKGIKYFVSFLYCLKSKGSNHFWWFKYESFQHFCLSTYCFGHILSRLTLYLFQIILVKIAQFLKTCSSFVNFTLVEQ